MRNPYLELYKMMGESTKIAPSFFIGKIVSALPLKVQVSDLVLDNEDFKIDSILKREKFYTGDTLLLVCVDSTYIAISKVVSA